MVYAKSTGESGPYAWNITGSFFWSSLLKIKDLFHWCTFWIIGNGHSINFWFDSWAGEPILVNADPRHTNMVMSLQQAQPLLSDVAPSLNLNLSDEEDRIQWKWNSQGTYTSKSVYKILVEGGKLISPNYRVWTAKVPPSVRIFGYFLLKGKLLTRDVLSRRGVHCQSNCVMCQTGRIESHFHLFFQCTYAKCVWNLVQSGFHTRLLTRSAPPANITTSRAAMQWMWETSARDVTGCGSLDVRKWQAIMLCTLWGIWRQRNCRIFRDELVPSQVLGYRVVQEVSLWFKFC